MAVMTLPEGYQEIRRLDIKADKKLVVGLNVLSVAIAFLLLAVGVFLRPIITLTSDIAMLLKMCGLLVTLMLYLVLHELVHGVCFRWYSGKRPRYGFTGLFAYASGQGYYSRSEYMVIGLAPVVVFGVVFGLLCALLPSEWFWWVYFMQVMNLSGAAGDFYLCWLFWRMPRDTLAGDEGVTMIFYAR